MDLGMIRNPHDIQLYVSHISLMPGQLKNDSRIQNPSFADGAAGLPAVEVNVAKSIRFNAS